MIIILTIIGHIQLPFMSEFSSQYEQNSEFRCFFWSDQMQVGVSMCMWEHQISLYCLVYCCCLGNISLSRVLLPSFDQLKVWTWGRDSIIKTESCQTWPISLQSISPQFVSFACKQVDRIFWSKSKVAVWRSSYKTHDLDFG